MFSTNAAVKGFTGNARGDGESFDAYKLRRSAEHQAAKLARRKLQGGTQLARHLRRHPAPIVIEGEVIQPKPMRGTYGKDLMAHFARLRLDAIKGAALAKQVPLAKAA